MERFLPLDFVSVSELDGDSSGKPILRMHVFGYEYTLLAPSLRSRYTWLTLIASRKVRTAPHTHTICTEHSHSTTHKNLHTTSQASYLASSSVHLPR